MLEPPKDDAEGVSTDRVRVWGEEVKLPHDHPDSDTFKERVGGDESETSHVPRIFVGAIVTTVVAFIGVLLYEFVTHVSLAWLVSAGEVIGLVVGAILLFHTVGWLVMDFPEKVRKLRGDDE